MYSNGDEQFFFNSFREWICSVSINSIFLLINIIIIIIVRLYTPSLSEHEIAGVIGTPIKLYNYPPMSDVCRLVWIVEWPRPADKLARFRFLRIVEFKRSIINNIRAMY